MLTPKDLDIIFYHDPCQDGLAAAFVARKYAREHNLTYELVAFVHGSPLPALQIKNKGILFVDCAPTTEQIHSLMDSKVLILDHHISNVDRINKSPLASGAHFDMHLSGVGLAWNFFYPSEPLPLSLAMIQDRDLWSWSMKGSKDYCAGLFLRCAGCITNAEKMSFLENECTDGLGFTLQLGQAINKANDIKIKRLAEAASKKIYLYNVLKVCLVNCDSDITSNLGNYIMEHYDYDFVVLWHYDNECYQLSLRSNGRADVSAICIRLGGGGHKNAAGCTSLIPPQDLFQ